MNGSGLIPASFDFVMVRDLDFVGGVLRRRDRGAESQQLSPASRAPAAQAKADQESPVTKVSTRGLEPLIRARNFKQRKSRLRGDSDVFLRVVARALEETLSSAMAACASSVRVDVGLPPGRVRPVEQGRARRSRDLLWKGGL